MKTTSVFYLARVSLIWLGIVVVLCVACSWALATFPERLSVLVAGLQRSVAEQRAQLTTKQEDLLNMQSHMQRYQTLRMQGLIGVPDRAAWVEELQASHQRLNLPGTLTYQLSAAKTAANTLSSPEPTPTPASAIPGETLVHDLQLELHDVHEEEVLNFISDFRARVKGRFHVQSCSFTDPKPTGMIAQCVLRFFTINNP